MFCYEIRIKVSKKGLTRLQAQGAFKKILENPMKTNSIEINPKVDVKALEVDLTSIYGDKIKISEGYTNGCYGSRDGSGGEGLTVWCDPTLLNDRCVDDDQEYANIHALLVESGAKKLDVDGDKLLDALDSLGLDIKRDNSYNWNGQGSDVEFMYDFDFSSVEHEGKCLFVVKYHCGGDPRGNYTDLSVWAFDSVDELYSVIVPYSMLNTRDGE